jgi:hypothetical protein
MFLSDPDQGERNEEWVEPDKMYSPMETLENVFSLVGQGNMNKRYKIAKRKVSLKVSDSDQQEKEEKEKSPHIAEEKLVIKTFSRVGLATQKDIQVLIRDYIYQGLSANAFNKSHNLLNQNREILDLTVNFSLRYQKIRSYQIKSVFKNFFSKNLFSTTFSSAESEWTNSFLKSFEKDEKAMQDSKASIASSWGSLSQKPSPRLIRFDKIQIGAF